MTDGGDRVVDAVVSDAVRDDEGSCRLGIIFPILGVSRDGDGDSRGSIVKVVVNRLSRRSDNASVIRPGTRCEDTKLNKDCKNFNCFFSFLK